MACVVVLFIWLFMFMLFKHNDIELVIELKMFDDYIKFYNEAQEEFGSKACVLMQVGSFYELLGVENDDEALGNVREISQLLNIQLTKINKNIKNVSRSNPLMAGFPTLALDKFLPVLLQNGYTVVCVEQTTAKIKNKMERRRSSVYSPSVQPLTPLGADDTVSNIYSQEDASLSFIVIEAILSAQQYVKGFVYSIANVNMTTNVFMMQECYKETCKIEDVMEDVTKELLRLQSTEIIVKVVRFGLWDINDVKHRWQALSSSIVVHHVDDDNKEYKRFKSLDYQNEYLRSLYKHIEFGLLDPIEMFGFSRLDTGRVCLMYALQFIASHEKRYLSNIAVPIVQKQRDRLVLELDTLKQLHVVPYRKTDGGTLYNIVNKTTTTLGRRGLWKILTSPFRDASVIEQRLRCVDKLDEIIGGKQGIKNVEEHLQSIVDLERLHRRMSLGVLGIKEMPSLVQSYEAVSNLIDMLGKEYSEQLGITCTIDTQLRECIEDMSKRFNLSAISEGNCPIWECFRGDHYPQISELVGKRMKIYSEMQDIKRELDSCLTKTDWLKLCFTEQDGWHFQITKIRYALLEKKCGKIFKVKNNTSICKITTDRLESLSADLINLEVLLDNKVNRIFESELKRYYQQYNKVMNTIANAVRDLDIYKSTLKTKYEYRYCRPVIVEDGKEAFLDCRQLRHPIIEQINDNVEYVPNDIVLDHKQRAIILYALNSCGKSSLLRAIGLAVIMAQSGLYVPCSEMRISPFYTLVSQVDLVDNMWKAQSSFVAEMVGLKHILEVANPHCLVLADEVCKGSEQYSATSIFAASVLRLVNKGSKVMFTTHLHGVSKLQQIQKNNLISIMHLSVLCEGNDIIFERTLKPGPCSDLYGLEVARAVGLDRVFMKQAFELRDEILQTNSEVLSSKRSRYNSKKIVNACEICGYKPSSSLQKPLHTHHIQFQKDADENGYIGKIHKNKKSNLVVLCDECHSDVHEERLTISGYIQTLSGVKLQYRRV
jgi:DNA mismatch repair protein MutS